MQKQGRGRQETILQAWAGFFLVLPQGIYITVFFSKWKMLTIDEAFFIPERRSQFDNLRNHQSSSEDHLRPD